MLALETVRPPRRLGKVQEAERENHGQAALDVREGDGQEGEFDCLAMLAQAAVSAHDWQLLYWRMAVWDIWLT